MLVITSNFGIFSLLPRNDRAYYTRAGRMTDTHALRILYVCSRSTSAALPLDITPNEAALDPHLWAAIALHHQRQTLVNTASYKSPLRRSVLPIGAHVYISAALTSLTGRQASHTTSGHVKKSQRPQFRDELYAITAVSRQTPFDMYWLTSVSTRKVFPTCVPRFRLILAVRGTGVQTRTPSPSAV